MNEWLHDAIAGLAVIVSSLSLFILHVIRDRVVRLEESNVQAAKDMGQMQGQIDRNTRRRY